MWVSMLGPSTAAKSVRHAVAILLTMLVDTRSLQQLGTKTPSLLLFFFGVRPKRWVIGRNVFHAVTTRSFLEITYTITGSNTGETPLTDVTVKDNANGVLDLAQLTVDPVATIDGVEVGGLTFEDGIPSWNGELAVGEDNVITYTAVINEDAAGSTLENKVSGLAAPSGSDEPLEPEGSPAAVHRSMI